MKIEFVDRRGWLSEEEFSDHMGVASLLPKPTPTELALSIGNLRPGFIGLLLAAAGFIGPGALTVAAVAWLYVRFGHLPLSQAAFLDGVNAAALAVIGVVAIHLGMVGLVSPLTWGIFIISLRLLLSLKVNSGWIILFGGVAGLLIR